MASRWQPSVAIIADSEHIQVSSKLSQQQAKRAQQATLPAESMKERTEPFLNN
jgi:hypothetical protein